MRVIERGKGLWSDHAADNADRLGLDWNDVVSIADATEGVRREKDDAAVDGYKYAFVGRDCQRRRTYMAGKVVLYAEERLWRVITIHEAD